MLVRDIFLYQIAIDLKIENLVLNNPTEKRTLGCASYSIHSVYN